MINGGNLDGTHYLVINGDRFAGFTVADGDADESLRDAINSISEETNVQASLTPEGSLKLQSPYPILIEYEGDAGFITGLEDAEVERTPGTCEE